MNERLSDTLKVIVPNGAVVASVNLLELKGFAELGLMALSAAYTIWRWRRDAKRKRPSADDDL